MLNHFYQIRCSFLSKNHLMIWPVTRRKSLTSMITWVLQSLASPLTLATCASICAQSASTIGILMTVITRPRDLSTRSQRSLRSRPIIPPRDLSESDFWSDQLMRPALISLRHVLQAITTSIWQWPLVPAHSRQRLTLRRTMSNSLVSTGRSSLSTVSRLWKQVHKRLSFQSTTSVLVWSDVIPNSTSSKQTNWEPT